METQLKFLIFFSTAFHLLLGWNRTKPERKMIDLDFFFVKISCDKLGRFIRNFFWFPLWWEKKHERIFFVAEIFHKVGKLGFIFNFKNSYPNLFSNPDILIQFLLNFHSTQIQKKISKVFSQIFHKSDFTKLLSHYSKGQVTRRFKSVGCLIASTTFVKVWPSKLFLTRSEKMRLEIRREEWVWRVEIEKGYCLNDEFMEVYKWIGSN